MCLTSAEELRELRRREKEQGIQSNWEIDSFMAADTLEGKREAIVTEYMLRILGLDVRKEMHRLAALMPWLPQCHVSLQCDGPDPHVIMCVVSFGTS